MLGRDVMRMPDPRAGGEVKPRGLSVDDPPRRPVGGSDADGAGGGLGAGAPL